jgi:hypothetical protein
MRQCSKPEGKRDIKHMAKWREVLRQKVTLDDAVLEFPKCEASHPRLPLMPRLFIFAFYCRQKLHYGCKCCKSDSMNFSPTLRRLKLKIHGSLRLCCVRSLIRSIDFFKRIEVLREPLRSALKNKNRTENLAREITEKNISADKQTDTLERSIMLPASILLLMLFNGEKNFSVQKRPIAKSFFLLLLLSS